MSTEMVEHFMLKNADTPRLTSLMAQQFVVTRTIRQTEIPALLDSWVTNTPVKMLFPTPPKNFLYFRKNVTPVHVGLFMMCKGFCSSCKIVSVCYDRLLFHERHIPSATNLTTRAHHWYNELYFRRLFKPVRIYHYW